MKQYYLCPVCGYDKLPEPPAHWSICSCCGTEFELDDFAKSHAELRAEWIANGCPWFSIYSTGKTKDWDPKKQLENLCKK